MVKPDPQCLPGGNKARYKVRKTMNSLLSLSVGDRDNPNENEYLPIRLHRYEFFYTNSYATDAKPGLYGA
jgi:hypothetical protein